MIDTTALCLPDCEAGLVSSDTLHSLSIMSPTTLAGDVMDTLAADTIVRLSRDILVKRARDTVAKLAGDMMRSLLET